MSNGEAYAIFKNIKSDKYDVIEKGWAIHQVLSAETHNGITKENLIEVLIWLWHQHYDAADRFDVLEETE